MPRSKLELNATKDRLIVTYRFRRDVTALLFGGGWLAVWWACLVFGIRKWLIHFEENKPLLKITIWVGAALLVGSFVGWWFLCVFLRRRREVTFAADAIVVQEITGRRIAEKRYASSRITNLRPSYPGWLETILFDYDGKPVGLELPARAEEREQILQHPAVQQYRALGTQDPV